MNKYPVVGPEFIQQFVDMDFFGYTANILKLTGTTDAVGQVIKDGPDAYEPDLDFPSDIRCRMAPVQAYKPQVGSWESKESVQTVSGNSYMIYLQGSYVIPMNRAIQVIDPDGIATTHLDIVSTDHDSFKVVTRVIGQLWE